MLERNLSLPEVTRVLLELGLDPNQRYQGPAYLRACTVWEGFLANGDFILSPWQDGPPHYAKEADNEDYRVWLAHARLLVRHGADPNATCIIRRQRTLGTSPRHYDHRSALYCVLVILWRTAKSQGWHEGLLEMMVDKGARLRQGELDELLELAGMIQVPEPFLQSVSEALSADGMMASERAVTALGTQNKVTVEVTRSPGLSLEESGSAEAGELLSTGQGNTAARLTRGGGHEQPVRPPAQPPVADRSVSMVRHLHGADAVGLFGVRHRTVQLGPGDAALGGAARGRRGEEELRKSADWERGRSEEL